jgi:ABC-type transport system substrate-binding protein
MPAMPRRILPPSPHNTLSAGAFLTDQWPQDLKDQYSYDPAAAKKLLADAGYPNGFTTNLVFDASGDADLLNILLSSWTAIGIKVNVTTLDATSWLAYVTNGKNDGLAMRSSSAWYGSTPGYQTADPVTAWIRHKLDHGKRPDLYRLL